MTKLLNINDRHQKVLAILVCLCVSALSHAGPLIFDINTDKSVYAPGNGVTLYVDVTNGTSSGFNGSLQVAISHLGCITTNLPGQSIVNLASQQNARNVFSWIPPAIDYQGYLVSVTVLDVNSNVVDSGSSAIDVSSDWGKFPRYGYVAHYDAGLDAYNIMWQLKNYHLNGIQFYDWQWKHHVPYNTNSSWPDIANRTISRATVNNLINAAHYYGMVAMNYNLYGGAYGNYLSDGSGVTLAMGIFSGAPASTNNQMNYPLPAGWATSLLCTMNNRDTNWQNYIFGKEQEVFSNINFDGWHIDSLGQNAVYDYNGNAFNLDDYNPQFINNAKATLNRRMLYNSVDAGGENQVALDANVDFIYSELWGNNSNYVDFKKRVDNVRSYGSKAIVMPAYMNYKMTSGSFNEPGVRLTDAAMFAAGGSHLELGDGDEMLHNEYFPNDTSVAMSVSLAAALHSYYDFLVGYENLLREGAVEANNPATITGVAASTNGSAGKVWIISKKTLGFNMLHLVNLLNNTNTAWRDDYGTYSVPTTQYNLPVKMYYSGVIGGGKLWYATPDTNSCQAVQLNYTAGSDAGGNFINFTIPQLQYWDLMWLELNGTNSALNQIRASAYDSMAGVGTEATSDIGGGQDVGFVNNVNGDSYLAFNKIDFGFGVTNISARVASAVANGTLEFRLDSPAGLLISTVVIGNTGGWQNWQTVTATVSGAAGVHKLFAVFRNAASNLNWFQFSSPLLPIPWISADVGAIGLTGSAAYSSGIFTVAGAGADIEGAADAFHSVYQAVGPNEEIRARVLSVQGTDPWAKAGVMMRESLASNAVNVAVVMTASNGVEFQYRTSMGGGTTATVVSGLSAPQWVRLVRNATNSFFGYYSADGTNWNQIGTTISLSMSNNVAAGLAVTAHNSGLLNTSTFDNVSLNQPPALAAISNRTLVAGMTLIITNTAIDPDVPAQSLTFNLLSSPGGAIIDTNTGVFSWRPTIAQSPSSQLVSVFVSDNGTPVMSATQNFTVTVLSPSRPILRSVALINGCLSCWINGDSGPDYNVQTSTNLSSWSLVSNYASPMVPFFLTDTNPATSPRRFYRVVLGP